MPSSKCGNHCQHTHHLGINRFLRKKSSRLLGFFLSTGRTIVRYYFPVGNEAGNKVTTGNNNVFIGFYAFTT